MSDKKAVESTVSKMLFAIDQLDWDGVRAALADEVEVDYTSLFGGQPERLETDVLLQRWQGLLPGFDATQHLTGPVVLTSRNGTRGIAETPMGLSAHDRRPGGWGGGNVESGSGAAGEYGSHIAGLGR